MAIPTFVAAGALDPRTGSSNPAWPSHETNDIGLLFVESANETITLTTAATFSEVTQIGVGTAGGLDGTRIGVFWSRATCATMGSPVVADAGNHVSTVILTFRGCIGSGDPWNVFDTSVEGTNGSAVTVPGGTTTVADCLVVAAVANGWDGDTTPSVDGWTNADLASLTERFDDNHATGNGGGIAVATGEKAATGSFSVTTATVTAGDSPLAHVMVALKPPASGGGGAVPQTWYYRSSAQGAHFA